MATPKLIPSEAVIASVLEVYERGQTIDALKRAEDFAPLAEWGGVGGCILGARIAANSGAPRLATRLSIRAWRTDRAHAAAQAQLAYEISQRRGSLALLLAMREWSATPGATAEQRAELLAIRARAAGDVRDFAAAEDLLNRAEALHPNVPWIRLQRAHLLECQDRVEDALEVARTAIALHRHPFYRPGVQISAHLLQLLDRDDDAIQLLRAADKVLQNGLVSAQLFSILSENGRWPEAEAAFDRYVTLSPLLEPRLREWATAQRGRIAYHLGKRAEAESLIRTLSDDFHKPFADKLAAPPLEPERVQLDVTFVRQHFKTCAPATLAAIGRYWRLPAEHLKLAEAMCYDGTPHWQQRSWAEQHGWTVREFRVTEETVIALLTRGIPFAISTVEATSAHMQAVVGFDRARGTLLLRDPGQPYLVEVHTQEFLKRYRPFGPHAMIFLPAAEQARLDSIPLPDSEIHDDYHRFSAALARHDRPGAAEILLGMEGRFGTHPLVWEARLELASYDANTTEQARCLDQLLELFPNNPARVLRRLGCLRDAPREERIGFLQKACAAKDADPALFIELARALEGDARSLPEAHRRLKRAMRLRPMDSSAIVVLANLRWEEGKLEEATELYRFAANLEGFREGLYQSWFLACRRTRHTDEAMDHLQDRFARFGRHSEQPALTLAWAWRELEQPVRARQVLTDASQLRPEDGYVLLSAAKLQASLGETAEADRSLETAKGKVRETDWLRAAAEIAESRLDTKAALEWAREILRREPLALDAHGGVARALSRLEGPNAPLTHLQAACIQFPHHYGLQRLLVDWSHDAGPEVAEAAARELLRVEPSDAWARREVAVALARSNQNEEALREATEAARIQPRNSYSFSILGHLNQRLGQLSDAQTHFRRAVELSVDNSDALNALLDLARTDTERKEELAFIEQQLIQQVVTGDGLLAFLGLARPVLEPDRLLCSLRQAHLERPDLWHAWSALVSQLVHLNRLDEALALARQASQRFAHLPTAWLDLATVLQRRNQPDEEIAAAERAFEMNPAWNRSAVALASALERRGRLADARRVYERALQHSPNDAQFHANLACLLWRLHQQDAAFAAVERALRSAPAYDWAWDLLKSWAQECGDAARTPNFSRALTLERPGEQRVWLMLARVLTDPAAMPERSAAVERALELDPRSTETWDLKAELLCLAERFDDGIAACTEGAARCTVDVHVLHGRHAWIEARRRNLPEAMRLMRALLAENASYVWGWHQLAHWLAEQNDLAGAGDALEHLARLRPFDAWVNRQLGFLRLKQDDASGARQAFTTALQLAPTDSVAAQNLFDLQLRAGALDEATDTLRVMETHQPGASTLSAEILILLRRNDTTAAGQRLEALCASPDPDPWPIANTADAFKNASQTTRALRVFKRALKNPNCNPEVATAGIRLLLSRRQLFSAVRWFLRLEPGEAQTRVAPVIVQGLAERKSRWLIGFLLWRRRDALAGTDAAWGQVGYALSNLDRMKAAARWLADWRSRAQVQPWMLFNLCVALRHLGRYPEADVVARHVLQTWGHREGSADLRLFLAVEDALSGSLPSAQHHLQQVVVRENVPHDQQLLELAKALVDFQQTPISDRPAKFKEIRPRLSQRFSSWRLLWVMKDVRRTFRRSGRLFTHQGGGWRARLWFGWRLNWQWLLVPLSPLLLALAAQPAVWIAVLLGVWISRRGKG